MKSLNFLVVACSLVVVASAQAQRSKSASKVVPPNLRPPAGMCRIWLEGVPPGRQPAPTDCASALRNRPARGQVIFGDDYAHPDSERHRANDDSRADSPLKGVVPLPRSMESNAADSAGADKKGSDAHRKSELHKPGGRKADSTKPDSTGRGHRNPIPPAD